MHSREASAGTQALRGPSYPFRRSLWEERYSHLPRFLQFFVCQNWFKKLFPIFNLKVRGSRAPGKHRLVGRCAVQGTGPRRWVSQVYPEVGTVEGLASRLMDLLDEASWADRVHILGALLRLLPDVSRDLCNRLRGILERLLNLDQPPSLEVHPWPRPQPRPPAHPGPPAPTRLLRSSVLRTRRRSSS